MAQTQTNRWGKTSRANVAPVALSCHLTPVPEIYAAVSLRMRQHRQCGPAHGMDGVPTYTGEAATQLVAVRAQDGGLYTPSPGWVNTVLRGPSPVSPPLERSRPG